MNKKTKPQISAAMTAAGVLTTNWSMLDQKVHELGGQPEDLHLLGRREDPRVVELVSATAGQLVKLGNEARAIRQKSVLVPPQLAFKTVLQPLHLFLLSKNGANATTLISSMNGTYFVSDYGKGMMGAPEFILGPVETALFGVFNCDQLQVVGWSETDFFGPKGWDHIKQFGLAKCLRDDGPYIRIAHSHQVDEWFRVAHDPISSGGYSSVWDVGYDQSDGRYLHGWNLGSGVRLLARGLLALRLAQ